MEDISWTALISPWSIMQMIADVIIIYAIVATARYLREIHKIIKDETDRKRIERYKKANPFG